MFNLIVEETIKELAGKRKVWRSNHKDYFGWTVGLKKTGGRRTVDFQVELFLIDEMPILITRVFGSKIKREELITALNLSFVLNEKDLTSLSLNREVEIREKVYEFETYIWTVSKCAVPIGAILELELKRLNCLMKVEDFFSDI